MPSFAAAGKKRGRPVGARTASTDRMVAAKAINSIVKIVGGVPELLHILDAAGEESEALTRLKESLKSAPALSLTDHIERCAITPWVLTKHYTAGLRNIKRAEAEQIALNGAPALVNDLQRNAIDFDIPCKQCKGSGKWMMNLCEDCFGVGTVKRSSEHKEFAVTNLLKITKLVEDKPTVSVNNTQQIALGAGFAESLAKAGYAALRSAPSDVVEGEKI